MGELDEDLACQELVELVTAYLEGYLATTERLVLRSIWRRALVPDIPRADAHDEARAG